MRRSIVAAVLALSTALTVLTAAASWAEPQGHARADHALTRAQRIVDGTASPGPAKRVEATLAMRDLFLSLPDLDTSERRQAASVLARPTDGDADQYGHGYTVDARRTCSGHFCLHWVSSTDDAPPSRTWVTRNLATLNRVWRHHVGTLGYRPPVQDGTRGGNKLFDVYLKELGSQGLYGYCAPERRKPGTKFLASGYCVLDNDFARSQYGVPPDDSLRVTAAHEFFHAIQFAYDYGEDQWFMEATATWMEERFADDVNDNRQYLSYGQVGQPAEPLDFFNSSGFNQYGNWPFFEYLSSRYGNRIVKRVWEQAGAFEGAPDKYSTRALRSVLGGRGAFESVFRTYTAHNTIPGRTYAEGDSWPHAPVDRRWVLSADNLEGERSFRIDHLASRNAVLRPDESLAGGHWRGRVTVDAPTDDTSPTAYLLIRRKSGRIVEKAVHLGPAGNGSAEFPFGHDTIRSVTVTLANASTRFSCWHEMSYSCQGRSRDDDQLFNLKVAAFTG
ncbi:MAG TPA: MXAN_6640 family putative metalloprotease [Nocardioides sp.]|nr:MXAN_6640 family putative metalloprotease [Nocardioides sp.]